MTVQKTGEGEGGMEVQEEAGTGLNWIFERATSILRISGCISLYRTGTGYNNDWGYNS